MAWQFHCGHTFANVGTFCQSYVAGLEIPSFDINNCYNQGSIEGPKIWKVIMVHLVSLLLPIWYEQELGFVIDSQVDKFGNVTEIRKVISHFIWADNLWIAADSSSKLWKMVASFTELINSRGL